jgi:hypothetical protein
MITELIEFILKEGVEENSFLAEAKNYYNYFKSTFKGFIDLEITKGENGWINILHWQSMEDVKACGEVLRTAPQEIAAYGAFTDKSAVKLTFLERKQYFS